MFGLTSSDIDSILKTLCRYPQVEEALIFGSRAMGNYKPGSDVDIALKGTINSETMIEISAELNEELLLPYKFDVVAYSSIIDKPFLEHIDQYGKRLYKKI